MTKFTSLYALNIDQISNFCNVLSRYKDSSEHSRNFWFSELARVAKFEAPFLSGAPTRECETSDFYITHRPLTIDIYDIPITIIEINN